MKFFYLRYFLKVWECGGFRKAAKELGISQPAVTSAVKTLEKELDTALFVKQANMLSVTPAGDIVIHHAKNVLHELQSMKLELERLQNGNKPVIQLAYCFCENLPSRIATEFSQRYPHIDLVMEQRNDRWILDTLFDGKYDVGITFCGQAEPFESVPFGELEFGAFFPKDSPLAKHEVLTPADLENATVYLGRMTPREDGLMRYFSAHGISVNYVQTGLLSDANIASFVEKRGSGVVLIPLCRAKKHDMLCCRRFSPPLLCDLRVVWLKKRTLSEDEERLIAYLSDPDPTHTR